MRRQEKVELPTTDEAGKVCKFKCEHLGCGWVFGNKRGREIHHAKCKHRNTFEVEKILDHCAKILPVGLGKATFLTKWTGYDQSENLWTPYANFNDTVVKDYLQANGIYDYQWKHRCPRCDKPCRSERGVKIHYVRVCKKFSEDQNFSDTVANRLHKEKVMSARQKYLRPVINCEDTPLQNCFSFKYLGSMFSADGDEDKDVARRIAMAVSRSGMLRHVMNSKRIPLSTKMKIYKSAVGSLFTYGSESWCLNEKCMRKLNGANAGCLSRFTGKTRVEESRAISCTYSLVNDIRKRRMAWLGHLLRMDESRLVKIAVREQWRMGEQGNLFLDAPKNLNFDKLCELASDRKQWKSLTRNLSSERPVTAPSCTPIRNQRRSCRATNIEYNEDKMADRCIPVEQPTLRTAKPVTLSVSAKVFTPTIHIGPTATRQSVDERAAKMYRVRDNHEVFFRPGYVPPELKQSKRAVKRKGKKRVILTDKQRRQWAREHWFLHHGQEVAPKGAKLEVDAGDAVNVTVKTARYILPTWTVAKAAVFDSSSDEDADSWSATDPPDSSTSWATTAPRPDLSGDYSSPNSISIWAATAPRSDLSDNWASPAPRPDLDNWSPRTPRKSNGDETTIMVTPVPVIVTNDESHITFVNFGNTENPNETINFMSPIAKTHDTHHQWTPGS